MYYNDFNLVRNNGKVDAVVDMVNDFQARGIPIDGVGFQAHISVDSPSINSDGKSYGHTS